MSERYTVEYGEDARLVMIVNHDTKDAYTIFQSCRELNRLSGEVATLRELLKEMHDAMRRYEDDVCEPGPPSHVDMMHRAWAAISQRGETP